MLSSSGGVLLGVVYLLVVKSSTHKGQLKLPEGIQLP